MSSPPDFAAVCSSLLRSGESVRFRATGRSMVPAIRDGDVLTVAPASPGESRVGDVVLYAGAWGLLAHRVVACLGDGQVHVRGDAIGSEDERVTPDRILGHVVELHRNGRPRGTGRWLARRLVARLLTRLSSVRVPR
jgi:signal peptidase I